MSTNHDLTEGFQAIPNIPKMAARLQELEQESDLTLTRRAVVAIGKLVVVIVYEEIQHIDGWEDIILRLAALFDCMCVEEAPLPDSDLGSTLRGQSP